MRIVITDDKQNQEKIATCHYLVRLVHLFRSATAAEDEPAEGYSPVAIPMEDAIRNLQRFNHALSLNGQRLAI